MSTISTILGNTARNANRGVRRAAQAAAPSPITDVAPPPAPQGYGADPAPPPVTGPSEDLTDLINQILGGVGGSGGGGGGGGSGLSQQQNDLLHQQARDLLTEQLKAYWAGNDITFGNLGAKGNLLDENFNTNLKLMQQGYQDQRNQLDRNSAAAGNYTSTGVNQARQSQNINQWYQGEGLNNQYQYNKALLGDAYKKAYIQSFLQQFQLNQQQQRQNNDIWS